MSLGAIIRKVLPRVIENAVSRRYRTYFLDVTELAARVTRLVSDRPLLEVGCGSGLLAQHLAASTSQEVLAIDPNGTPGAEAEYHKNLTFKKASTRELIVSGNVKMGGVVLCDVLHHVRPAYRSELITDCEYLLDEGGFLIIKDWEPDRSLAHFLCYLSDRWVSHDREVSFAKPSEMTKIVDQLASLTLVETQIIAPHSNNYMLVFQKSHG